MHVVMVLVMVLPNVGCFVVLGEEGVEIVSLCVCVGGVSGYLPNRELFDYFCSSYFFQLSSISVSLPTRGEGLTVFQCGLNLSVGMSIKVSKERSQEMNLTLCREKVDLVMRTERGNHDSCFQVLLVQWKSITPTLKESSVGSCFGRAILGTLKGLGHAVLGIKENIRNNSGSVISLLLLCNITQKLSWLKYASFIFSPVSLGQLGPG